MWAPGWAVPPPILACSSAAQMLLKQLLVPDNAGALLRLSLPRLACLGPRQIANGVPSCHAAVKQPVLRAQQCYGAEALDPVAMLHVWSIRKALFAKKPRPAPYTVAALLSIRPDCFDLCEASQDRC